MLRNQMRNLVAAAVAALQNAGALPAFKIPHFQVEAPENPAHGDYSSNAAMILAKSARVSLAEIAEKVAGEIRAARSPLAAKINVAAPGFLNFTLADTSLLHLLNSVLSSPDKWGRSDVGRDKTVRVEYFQLNVAKRPHIGHLRSAVIGDAIKRMLLMFGYNAVSDTHVGDWGTQFGILLLGYKERHLVTAVGGDPFDALEYLYNEEVSDIEKDPARREQAKEEFAKLERGDPENRKIWQWMVEISMKELESSAKRLGLLLFDMHVGESAYETIIPKIVGLALEKRIAKKLADGALVVDLTNEGLDEAVLVKSDGASTYLLRDLATVQYMKEKLKFWKNLYVVDVRQSHHFKQVFRVAELLGLDGVGESQHIEFGFMSSAEGVLSTRKGTAISLKSVLDEARTRALKVIKEKNPDLKNSEAVAEAVGAGALKYFDLSHHRKSDIVFGWDEALSFEGNTGPYLQYTHARLKSILRKKSDYAKAARVSPDVGLDDLEHRLLAAMLRFPEAIEDALVDYTPNTLANYLYNLAKLANEFYHSHPVLQEPDEEKKHFRLALVSTVALTLSNGLYLLGIHAPEEM